MTYKFTLLVFAFLVGIGAYADHPSTDATTKDKIYIEDFEISAGETKTINIMINSTTTGKSVIVEQFDIYFPEGITVDQDKYGYVINSGALQPSRNTSTNGNYRSDLNGGFRVLIYNSSNYPLEGKEGVIATLSVTASSTFTSGTGTIKDILVNYDGETGTSYWCDDNTFLVNGGATSGSFSIGSVGTATYYDSRAYTMPKGVTGSIVTGLSDGTVTESQLYTAGDVVPAGTGLLVRGAAASYTFNYAKDASTATPATGNLLKGSDAAAMTADGEVYYMLSLADGSTDPTTLGFYYGKADGAAFLNGAHRAYLPLTSAQAASVRYLLDPTGGTTGITAARQRIETQTYDLQGRRVNRPDRGIYVVKGRKVLVK